MYYTIYILVGVALAALLLGVAWLTRQRQPVSTFEIRCRCGDRAQHLIGATWWCSRCVWNEMDRNPARRRGDS